MEALQKLTRRQIEALQVIVARESPAQGVSLNDVARELKVTPPSALGHLTPLESLGLIERHRGKTRATARGRQTVVEYQRHHRVAEQLFSGLGMSPKDICDAAREVDLAISHRTIERVYHASGKPESCPHGQAIPPCHHKHEGA